MKLPPYYHHCSRCRTIAGENSITQVPELLREFQVSRPLLVSGNSAIREGYVKRLLSLLTEQGISIEGHVFDLSSDSDADQVNAAVETYRELSCDSIIAIGGGSVIDSAKGINILASHPAAEDIRAFSGSGTITKRLGPLIVVPTTSGSGSECTSAAVIMDPIIRKKLLIQSDHMIPDAAIIDPVLTMSLPAHLTASTGMDALTHACEAYTSMGKNPISDGKAVEAIKLITGNIETAVAHPEDLSARAAMAVGSHLAGQAFSSAMVGVVHAIGHAVGAVCRVDHGTCMSILLPYGLEYNYHRIGCELKELSSLFSGEPSAEGMIESIRTLNRRLDSLTEGKHPLRFHDVLQPDAAPAVHPEDLQIIAQKALGDGALIYNREQLDQEDILHILEAAYWGYPLDRDLVKKGDR